MKLFYKKNMFIIFLLFAIIFTGYKLCCSHYLKKKLTIAFCIDNNYVYPVIGSLTSILENNSLKNYYKFKILLNSDVEEKNKEKLKNIEKKYKNCSIELINMKDEFKNSIGKYWPVVIYYRLLLPQILEKEEKCLYLDGDTLALKDISEIFDINMDDFYVGGIRDFGFVNEKSDYYKTLEIENLQTYICSGVMLMNLKKMREDNLIKKINKLIELNDKENKFYWPDQDIINICCFGKIKVLPCEYGFLSHIKNESYEDSEYAKWTYSKEIWDKGRNNPTIVHATKPKPWCGFDRFTKMWWQYIKKSDFFNEIFEKYSENFNEKEKSIIENIGLT